MITLCVHNYKGQRFFGSVDNLYSLCVIYNRLNSWVMCFF